MNLSKEAKMLSGELSQEEIREWSRFLEEMFPDSLRAPKGFDDFEINLTPGEEAIIARIDEIRMVSEFSGQEALLGPFTIRIPLRDVRDFSHAPLKPVKISGYHPHISGETPCWGSWAGKFNALLREHQWDVFLGLCIAFLKSYNPYDAYFDPFAEYRCSSCGALYQENELFWCASCDEEICPNCSREVEVAKHRFVSLCGYCAGDSTYFCPECGRYTLFLDESERKFCFSCERYVHLYCWEDHLREAHSQERCSTCGEFWDEEEILVCVDCGALICPDCAASQNRVFRCAGCLAKERKEKYFDEIDEHTAEKVFAEAPSLEA